MEGHLTAAVASEREEIDLLAIFSCAMFTKVRELRCSHNLKSWIPNPTPERVIKWSNENSTKTKCREEKRETFVYN